jgi:hypothetical protein
MRKHLEIVNRKDELRASDNIIYEMREKESDSDACCVSGLGRVCVGCITMSSSNSNNTW